MQGSLTVTQRKEKQGYAFQLKSPLQSEAVSWNFGEEDAKELDALSAITGKDPAETMAIALAALFKANPEDFTS